MQQFIYKLFLVELTTICYTQLQENFEKFAFLGFRKPGLLHSCSCFPRSSVAQAQRLSSSLLTHAVCAPTRLLDAMIYQSTDKASLNEVL